VTAKLYQIPPQNFYKKLPKRVLKRKKTITPGELKTNFFFNEYIIFILIYRVLVLLEIQILLFQKERMIWAILKEEMVRIFIFFITDYINQWVLV